MANTDLRQAEKEAMQLLARAKQDAEILKTLSADFKMKKTSFSASKACHAEDQDSRRLKSEAATRAIEYEMSLQRNEWPRDEESLRLINVLGDACWKSGMLEKAEEVFQEVLESSTAVLDHEADFTLEMSAKLKRVQERVTTGQEIVRRAANASLYRKRASDDRASGAASSTERYDEGPDEVDGLYLPLESGLSYEDDHKLPMAISQYYNLWPRVLYEKRPWDDAAAALTNKEPSKFTPILDYLSILLEDDDDHEFRYRLLSASVASKCDSLIKNLQLDQPQRVKGKDEWTPLLAAAFNGHLEVVQYLIKQRADVKLQEIKPAEDQPVTVAWAGDLAIEYHETLQLTEKVMKLRNIELGNDHPNTLTLVHDLAIEDSGAGRRGEALALTEEILEVQKSMLGKDHPETLRSMHSLAIAYSEAGRRAEALQLMEEVVELRKSKLGEDHPETLRSMHNLAIRYSEAGRREEALQLTEKVVELHKSKLGADHPDTVRSMGNLAIMYSEAGRRAEALRLTEKVVELRRSKLGEDHPDTLASERLLASQRPQRSKPKFLQWFRSGRNK
ncbi:hypothetical protein LTR96_011311 [Exophiala xenobiotica]|nr:hypothetical protein LTR41_011196 [Exophiala xenobiotica]KAK5215358.1 hypothetical protein LTR72_011580 [Exophiala xenobiotica]KAK5220363.1 hypothetical protein LTR47_011196 [Exophiala xenobiotica]KAK5242779.1 hypothetical protein LTS06_011295 [Exophiala xenobiotica]KAK5260991.1 hypothetical protein LTR40_003094 [Exophiala xenobiotica]